MQIQLIAWLAAALTQPLSGPAAPPSTDPAPLMTAYEVVQLAPGIHGFVWKNPLDNPIQGNALFIINDDDVIVVDTSLLPSTARVMAAELRKLTSKPVRYVVNTHWHDDHHNGNQVYRELWPGAEFIAHRDTREDMFSKTYDVRANDLANLETAIARYERWAATGKDDDGKELAPERRKRAGEIAALDRALRTLGGHRKRRRREGAGAGATEARRRDCRARSRAGA